MLQGLLDFAIGLGCGLVGGAVLIPSLVKVTS